MEQNIKLHGSKTFESATFTPKGNGKLVQSVTSKSQSNDPAANIGDNDAKEYENEIIKEFAKNLFSENFGSTAISGLIGILYSLFVAWIPVAIGYAAQTLATAIGTSAGTTEKNVKIISAEDIIFNRLAITDINFFSDKFGSDPTTGQKKELDPKSPVKKFRESIAKWYYAIRSISIIILLCILIYIGVKLAYASVAEEQAKYKEWLKNWAVSMALVFVLPYGMILVINVNNALVDMLGNSSLMESMIRETKFRKY